jgi:uncharacterized protein YbcI
MEPALADAGHELSAVVGQIERELLRLQEDSYGAGASSIKAYVHDDAVFVLIDVELTRAERTLTEAGRESAVREMRETFQSVIEPTFTAIIERATGRRVDSFFSGMSMADTYSIEVFRLADPA